MFFSCVIILLVNSWSTPGADPRMLGLQSAERTSGGDLSPMGCPARVSELLSPHLCKAKNAAEPLLSSPSPMAGTEPSLRATCRFSGPSRCHGKTGTFGARGLTWDACIIDHLAFCSPPPQNHFLGHPSCLPRVLFPCDSREAPQGFVTVSIPTPFSLRIILYSSFQTIQYSLGYSYYQVAGIVKVGVVRSLAFIPYFFVLLPMCINY